MRKKPVPQVRCIHVQLHLKIRLSKKTDWVDYASDVFVGLGQRMFATDGGEYPIMDVREIKLNTGLKMDPAADANNN